MGQATVNPEKNQSAVVASLPTIVLRCRLIVPIPKMKSMRPSSINHVPVILIVTATCHRQSSLDVLSLVEYTSVLQVEQTSLSKGLFAKRILIGLYLPTNNVTDTALE